MTRWLNYLVSALKLPEAEDANLDSAETIALHRGIICQKPFLQQVYLDQYAFFVDQRRQIADLSGKLLEMGSGAGFLKKMMPDVITSDICPDPSIDQVIDATHLPFQDGELKGIFLLNVLHHLPKIEQFLNEADRVLVTGGRIIMIEPANTWFSRLIYKHLHHEPFDETVVSWDLPAGGGRLSGSNQALPSIIFIRDRRIFENTFPRLQVKLIRHQTVLTFLLSGGMSWKVMAPLWSYPLFRWLDRILSVGISPFPLFQYTVLEKASKV